MVTNPPKISTIIVAEVASLARCGSRVGGSEAINLKTPPSEAVLLIGCDSSSAAEDGSTVGAVIVDSILAELHEARIKTKLNASVKKNDKWMRFLVIDIETFIWNVNPIIYLALDSKSILGMLQYLSRFNKFITS